MENGFSELEKLVKNFNEAYRQFIDADKMASLLEKDQKPFLDDLQNTLDDGNKSEAKIKREAQGSRQYRDYIKAMVLARHEANVQQARKESYSLLIDVKRSELAMERAKIEKGIYHTGG